MSKRERRPIVGVHALLMTPFTKNYELNEENLRREIDWLIKWGVDGVAPVGSVGEHAHLTASEKKKIYEVVIDQTPSDKITTAGTSAPTTLQCLELTKYAEDLGYDAAMPVVPWYWQCAEDEAYRHYRVLSDKTDIQIMVYHNPTNAKLFMKPEFLAKLAELDGVTAIKEIVDDIVHVHKTIRLVGDNANFLSVSSFFLESLILGGKGGVVGVLSSPTLVECYKAFKAGNMDRAWEFQNRITMLASSFPYEHNKDHVIGDVKGQCSAAMGIDMGPPALPYRPATKDEIAEYRKKFEKCKLLPPIK